MPAAASASVETVASGDPTAQAFPSDGHPDSPEPARPLAFYRPAHARGGDGGTVVGPPFRHLVLALEPAQIVDHARRLTAALTRSRSLTIALVCLIDGFGEIFAAHNPALLADPDGYLARIDEVVQALAGAIRAAGVSCAAEVLVGAPALELARYLERTDADLLLLGRDIPGASARLTTRRWRSLSIRARLT
jgi:hypothetical protein